MVGPVIRLVYKPRAVKDIKKLDKVAKKLLLAGLERFRVDPWHYAVKLKRSQLIGQYRFRVGNYRVIFDLEGRDVVVLRVMHRREVYQR